MSSLRFLCALGVFAFPTSSQSAKTCTKRPVEEIQKLGSRFSRKARAPSSGSPAAKSRRNDASSRASPALPRADARIRSRAAVNEATDIDFGRGNGSSAGYDRCSNTERNRIGGRKVIDLQQAPGKGRSTSPPQSPDHSIGRWVRAGRKPQPGPRTQVDEIRAQGDIQRRRRELSSYIRDRHRPASGPLLQNRPGKRVTAASHRKGDNQVSDFAGLGDQGGNLRPGILFMVPSDLPHAPILTGPVPIECRHEISTGILATPNRRAPQPSSRKLDCGSAKTPIRR